MGGKRLGRGRKRGTLPRTFTEGTLSRLDRRRVEARALVEMAEAVLEEHGGDASVLRTRATFRAVHLDALLQRQEAELARGQPIDVPSYLAGCQAFLRYADKLGLERRARPVETLHQYMARRAAESAAQPVVAEQPATTPEAGA